MDRKGEKNGMNELKHMMENAEEQLFLYPDLSAFEKGKRMLKKALLHQKIAPIDRYSWPNAMLAEGLLAAFTATGDRQALLEVCAYLERWGKKEYRIHTADNIMNGSLALWIEGLMDPGLMLEEARPKAGGLQQTCEQARERCADWLRKAPKTTGGLLAYRNWHPDWLFADTIGMICPFLCRYGARMKDEALLDLGIAQLEGFLERGMDPDTGLPYHGYDEKTGEKYSIVGWGRACGWLLKGLSGSLPWLIGRPAAFRRLLDAYRRLTRSVLSYQRPDGGFSWQLPAREGHRDTSAEGMIGAALAFGLRMGYDQEKGTAEEAMQRLFLAMQTSLENGDITDCLGECRGFGEYPQSYRAYPWGLGSALSFFGEKLAYEKTVSEQKADK